MPLAFARDGGRTVVTLLGTGGSDDRDALFDPEHDAHLAGLFLAGLFFDHLAERRREWDVCDFHELRAESPLLSASASFASSSTDAMIDDAREPRAGCQVVPLARGAAPSPLPKKLRKNLAYYLARARRMGPVRFERVTGERVEQAVDGLVALRTRRWRERGEPGVLGHPATVRMMRDAAPALDAEGILRLHTMHVGDASPRPRSRPPTGLQLPLHQRVGSVARAREPGHADLRARHRRSAPRRAPLADFLRGREPSKSHFGPIDHACFRRLLESRRSSA